MPLKVNVSKDNARGVYVYTVNHDGAEIPFMERKFGGVDKRIKAAADSKSQADESADEQG